LGKSGWAAEALESWPSMMLESESVLERGGLERNRTISGAGDYHRAMAEMALAYVARVSAVSLIGWRR